jgi:hypothetical protein
MWLSWCSNEPSIGELMVRLEAFLLLFLLRWSFSMALAAMLVKVNGLMLTDC